MNSTAPHNILDEVFFHIKNMLRNENHNNYFENSIFILLIKNIYTSESKKTDFGEISRSTGIGDSYTLRPRSWFVGVLFDVCDAFLLFLLRFILWLGYEHNSNSGLRLIFLSSVISRDSHECALYKSCDSYDCCSLSCYNHWPRMWACSCSMFLFRRACSCATRL